MQLLDSLPNRLLEAVPNPLLASLQDIANNVQIQSNFCIIHPNYKPLELPAEVVARFQRLPLELQQKYLNLQLRSFLYGIYYNGSMQATLAPEDETSSVALLPNLENNTFLGMNLAFYERLHRSNFGRGYFDPGWQVLRQESDGALAVKKGELTLHIERDRHLIPSQQSAEIGDVVAIRMPKNLMQNGFYMAVSNAGLHNWSYSNSNPTTIRIYFHLTPEGAVAVMASLTQQLNEIKIPFSFKVLYNPAGYNRYDSGVLYFERCQYPIVRYVLQEIYTENQAHFKPQIPLFTKQLSPGLAVAEEPNHKFSEQESFGMNRCQIVANGLLEARHKGDNSSDSRMNAILQQFFLLKIDWQCPYLNANSEDIYTPLY
jgi:hypothetical protein